MKKQWIIVHEQKWALLEHDGETVGCIQQNVLGDWAAWANNTFCGAFTTIEKAQAAVEEDVS